MRRKDRATCFESVVVFGTAREILDQEQNKLYFGGKQSGKLLFLFERNCMLIFYIFNYKNRKRII